MTRRFNQAYAFLPFILLIQLYPSKVVYAQDLGDKSPKELRIASATASVASETAMFDSVRFVPLETVKASEFRQISKLLVMKDRYIILDESLDIVLLFDRNGRFINKIATNNKDLPDPFQDIYNLAVNHAERTIACSFAEPHKVVCYFDFEGRFLRKEDVKARIQETVFFNNLEIRYYRYRTELTEPKDGLFPNIEVFDRKTRQRTNANLYFDTARMDYRDELFGIKRYFYPSGQNHLFFTQPYNYTIYELLPSGILTERYRIILPLENSLPTDFLSDSSYDGHRKEYIHTNSTTKYVPNRVYYFLNVYQAGDWLTFQMTAGNALLYHLETNDLYDFSHIELSNWGFPSTPHTRKILAVDGNALITNVDFKTIKRFYEDNPDDDRLRIADLKRFLQKSFRNPILQFSYLKQ
ncbi:6-bladed beta-propeller [Parapedobacter sp. 10938]|uniref:6-bladed beta-propeller n=1 Tax=Parapedobacter flavus TaxID=3110225 RepID=UPI002DBBB470|nr:6-bladed beta-propeller [Parapedobacter sp. 10938]MEC3881177.1 6-bladed beta-propeller [Parapedobacter sp. 10938]